MAVIRHMVVSCACWPALVLASKTPRLIVNMGEQRSLKCRHQQAHSVPVQLSADVDPVVAVVVLLLHGTHSALARLPPEL